MADNTVEIAIKAVDQTNAAIDGAKKNLASLTGVAQKTGTDAGKALSNGFQISGQEISQVVSRVNPMLGSIVGAISPVTAALAIATAGVLAFKQAWQLALLGADASELADKYVQITGGIRASEEMMQKLRAATQGTVTDMDLMIIANRTINMGVTKNADEMARLAAIFTDLGDASAMSAKEAVSAGMQAVAALQTRGLKTLGLALDDTKIWDEYARKLGITASALDDVQKRAALVQAILATAPAGLEGATASAADKAEAMHVSIKNLNVAIGQSIMDMLGLGDAVTAVADKATAAIKRSLGAQGLRDIYGPLFEKMWEAEQPKQKWNDVAQEFQDDPETLKRLALLQQHLRGVFDEVAAGTRTYEDAVTILDIYLGKQDANLTAMNLTAAGMQMASDGALMLAQSVNSIPNLVTIAVQFQVDKDTSYLSNALLIGSNGMMTGGASKRTLDFGKTWELEASAAEAAAKAGASSAKSFATAYEAEMKAREAELRSLAQELLTPTDVTAQDMAATAAGTYADKWDEYARRMRAIAAGQDSVWRQMVPKDVLAQGEDAIKAWAQTQEQAFYAGQKPGEVNWEAFISNAREVVAAKAAKEAMLQEAMRRLAAAGIGGMSASDIGGSLGIGAGTAVVGTEMAATFGAGLVSNDTASAVTLAFQAQMNAQQEVWTSVGVLCISWFVLGIKKGITPQTGRDIVNALWPWFAEIMDRERPLP